MELKNNHFYWVKLVTMYCGSKDKLEVTVEKTIGHCYKTLGGWVAWEVIGSNEMFLNYHIDKKMTHLQTCAIPIKEI